LFICLSIYLHEVTREPLGISSNLILERSNKFLRHISNLGQYRARITDILHEVTHVFIAFLDRNEIETYSSTKYLKLILYRNVNTQFILFREACEASTTTLPRASLSKCIYRN
jgi:hypothetical protein